MNDLSNHRRFVWYKENSCDILVYDGEGSELLLHCFPVRSSHFIINRNEMPLFLSISYLIYMLIGMVKYRKPSMAVLFAIIRRLNPKVVITYIDNSPAICGVKKMYPLMPVIAVQNGTRWDYAKNDAVRMKYDYYFSFGSVEADIFLQGGHVVSNYHPVGSLRGGIFKENLTSFESKKFDLCYISQFGQIPIDSTSLDKWTNEVYATYLEVGKQYFYVIAKYAEENSLSLCVAMRSHIDSYDFETERNLFSYLGNLNIEYVPQSGFSSYIAVQASRLSFTISSTLGYEALGFGERVIFAKDVEAVASLVRQGIWTDNLVTHRLPELQRLLSLDYSELRYKATELLQMKNDIYTDYSESARIYYMNYDSEQKPQWIIRNKIDELLANCELPPKIRLSGEQVR